MPIEFGQGSGSAGIPTGHKRRRVHQGIGISPPFDPHTGEYATFRVEGVHPFCAMMQVAAADTHEDYVVCRGFDPRIRKFIDYAAGDSDKPGISVAKPFGARTTGTYTVGEVYPAFLPTQGVTSRDGVTEDYVPPSPTTVDWRVGQNPGTATPTGTGGHPQDLSAAIEELTDDNSKYVQWMLISGGGTPAKILWGVATSNWKDNGATCDSVDVNPCDDCDGANPDAGTTHTVFIPKSAQQDPNVISGETIGYELATDGTYCNASDCLDDKIGTIKMWALAAGEIPPGWGQCDGSENSVVNGGSGIDLQDKFVRGAATSGGSGGTERHEHVFSLTIQPHIEADMRHSHMFNVELTVPPHSVQDLLHNHAVDFTPGDLYLAGAGGDPQFQEVSACVLKPENPVDGIVTLDSCGSATDWGPLSHETASYVGVTGLGGDFLEQLNHYYSYTMEDAEHLPEYIEMIFIERLDNSA